MGLLDGGIAAEMAAAFGDIYLDATLFRNAQTPDGEGGWIEGILESAAVKVQENDLSESARAAAGYTAKDAQFLILTQAVPASFALDTDWKMAFGGVVYQIVAPVRLDPAKSHFMARAERTSEAVPDFD